MKRSRSWTIRGDIEALDALVDDFAQRRSITIEGGGRRLLLRRGSPERMRERGRLTHEDDLPLKGSIELLADDERGTRVTATLEPDRAGRLLGRGPVGGALGRRFDQLFGELLNDLGQSLGDNRLP